MGRAKTASGAPACFLSGISGWFSLSLGAWVPKKLARRRMVSAGAMLLDRLGPPGFRFTDFRAPAFTLSVTLTRARALMARPWSARCYGVARQREGSRQNSIGGSGVLSLRHFSGWFSLSPGAWVPKNLARRRKQINKTRRLLTNRPCSSLVYEESASKRTSTRQQLDCAKTL